MFQAPYHNTNLSKALSILDGCGNAVLGRGEQEGDSYIYSNHIIKETLPSALADQNASIRAIILCRKIRQIYQANLVHLLWPEYIYV